MHYKTKIIDRTCCSIIDCSQYSAKHPCPTVHCAVLESYNEDSSAWEKGRQEYLEEMSEGNITAGIF